MSAPPAGAVFAAALARPQNIQACHFATTRSSLDAVPTSEDAADMERACILASDANADGPQRRVRLPQVHLRFRPRSHARQTRRPAARFRLCAGADELSVPSAIPGAGRLTPPLARAPNCLDCSVAGWPPALLPPPLGALRLVEPTVCNSSVQPAVLSSGAPGPVDRTRRAMRAADWVPSMAGRELPSRRA